MAINRRSVLKGLALTPTFAMFRSHLASLFLPSPASPGSVYILLHGMFFMEFSGDTPQKRKLYVASPDHAAHHFCSRRSGVFQKIDKDIDLFSKLPQGSQVSFPSEIAQFPKSLIGSNGPVAATSYRCKIILPAPKNIFAYRSDTKDHFVPVVSSKVGRAILDSTGPRLATITCLEYDPGADGPYVESYYAEHKTRPSPKEANAALDAAKQICGSSFDLKFPEPGSYYPMALIDSPGSLPTGVGQDDEKELEELLKGGKLACDEQPGPPTFHQKGADVASCPQFGINHP